jgi:DNA-binding transcriptional MerR regulator
MRIGELAAQAGVTTKTIRYYEQIGVLPAPTRTPSGYRDHGPDAVQRLGFIRAAQAIGFTLGEIRQIIGLRDRGDTPCTHVADLLASHTADLDRRIAELRHLRAELQQLAERAQHLDPRECAPERICHLIG